MTGHPAVALNVAYEIVPNLIITPEINYTSFGDERSGFVAREFRRFLVRLTLRSTSPTVDAPVTELP